MPVNLNSICVLQVVPELTTGGVERTTIEVAEGIVKAGGRALVASAGGRLEDQLAAVGGELIRMDLATKSPLKVIGNIGGLKAIIAREGVKIVHARSRAPAWSARAAARDLKVPFVTTYHGVYSETNALKKLYNSVMASGDIVIANSNYTATQVAARYPVPPGALTVIERGVDLEVFDIARVSAERIAAFGGGLTSRLQPGARLFIVPARLTRWKGQEVAIAAAARLRERGLDDFMLAIAGDHQGREKYLAGLQEQIAAAGLQDHVVLTGNIDDMAAAFAASDFAIVPSIEPEAFGRTAVEAQAMGRPVIASRIGAFPETVVEGETGWLVEPGDPDALAQAMEQAARMSAEDYAAWSAAAIHNATSRFSAAKMVSATLDCYARLLP